MPVALLAGETSAAEWDVPDWVRASAKEHVIQRGTGHMMMLEAPAEFCRIVRTLVDGLGGAAPAERR
jgi:pimeloyl-ACP methyl ester carboxylesterase